MEMEINMNRKISFFILIFCAFQLTGCATGALNGFISDPERIEKTNSTFKVENIYMSENYLVICIKGETSDGYFIHHLRNSMSKSHYYPNVKEIPTLSKTHMNTERSCQSIVNDPRDWENIQINTLKDSAIINKINKNPLLDPRSLNLKSEAYIFNTENNIKLLFVNESNVFFGANYLYVEVPNKHIELKQKNAALKTLYIFSPITFAFDIITSPIQFIMLLLNYKT